MRAWLILAALVGPASGHAAARLEIRGAAAHVTIIPEARSDIRVSVIRKSTVLPVRVFQSGDVTVVDGGLGHRVKGCPRLGSGIGVRVSGVGNIVEAELPRLVIRVPMDARVIAGDGVSGEFDRAASLDFESRGCGNWTIANVAGRLRLSQIGSGAVRAGRSGSADLNVAGRGAIVSGPIAGLLTAVSSGEGTINVASVDGSMMARVAGSGRVDVRAGAAARINASVAGSGAVSFGGDAGGVTASVAGSGNITVAHAGGPVTRRIFGPGQIQVGH
jgi:hypothetical protein